MKNFFVHKNFYPKARGLRQEFVDQFIDAKHTHAKRFVWDFWYDRDQYRLVRTPAYHYFSEKVYVDFHSYLVQWGRENLGCHDISPPWLSYYVDGCFQNMHSDVPHGPWAFVFSLTPNRKNYIGGETFILKPNVLDYWPNFNSAKEYERSSFMDLIPSNMNQLVVFDPRYPHGVTEVKGELDPLRSRLVVHGWFVNPRPYVKGGLSTKSAQKAIEGALVELSGLLQQIELLNGTVSLRLQVGRNGDVKSYQVLTDTLRSTAARQQEVKIFHKELKSIFKNTSFARARTESSLTIPLIFK